MESPTHNQLKTQNKTRSSNIFNRVYKLTNETNMFAKLLSPKSSKLSRNGLSRRNKRKDDIIDDQSHNPIEVSNVNDNLSSCYLPIDSKLTDESQVIQTNCPVKLGQCKNNRNSNRQVKNNNNYNKNNKNQLNNENESHSGHHCSSSVLIGKRENVHQNDHDNDEEHLIEEGKRKNELDSQNEAHLVNTNESFEANGIEGNDQPNDCCPIDSPDNLLTSTLVNQVTFKQYESLLPKKAMKNENNGPLNNNQLDHLQSTYSCNHNSSNLKSQNDHMNLETSLDNRIHSFDHHETSTGDFNDPLSKLLLERIRLLEEENSNLIAESEQQRIQYEKCLDDVAASVVNALLSQKNLRQECVQLRRRVRELEQQNQLITLVLEEQLVTSSNKSKSDATLINNFNNNHLINNKNKDTLNNVKTCSKDSSIVNNHQIYLTTNGSSLLPLSSLGVGKLSSDKLDDNGITNGDDDSNRPARNDNLNYTDSQTNAIINSEFISPCSYLSSTSSSNSLPSSSSSGLSEMARQFEQALSSLLTDSTSPKEMAYQPTKALSSSSSSSTSSPSSSSNKLPKDSTVLYSNEANFSINTTNEVQSITFVKPVNTRETIKTRKSSVEQIKMKMDQESGLKGKEKYVLVNDEAGYCWRTSSDRNEVDKEIDDVDGVSGPINCSNGSSTGLRQLTRPSRESFLTSLKMEKDSSLYPTSSDFHCLSVNSNGASILPSSSPSLFSSSLGQGRSISSPTTTETVTSNEPEKLSRKIRESFESDCCRSMKRPHYSFNNRNHNVESYKETRSSQYSGNCLPIQSMSELNSKLGYQSNIIDRSGEQIRRDDFISTKPRTTITETSTSTSTAVAIKTISPSTSVSLLDDKLKLSSTNLIDLTKLKSSPSNQICSLVNTSQKKSSSNINLVHNLTSIHFSSSPSSSSSSSLPPSSSLIHSSTSSSLSSALAGSPLSSSSSCSSPKKILFDRNADNVETSNLDSSLFQVNARSNQQEKRILFILASNQPNPSSISSSSSSFSSASSSSSSFSIEKSSCDNKSINKPINLELRALSSSSSDSKSIPSLDKDSPISGEISSDTNGELGSKDEGYSTMSSDVQSDATLSGSSFISNNNANITINSTNTIFPVNPSITKQSTESNSGKTILIEKQNFTTSKPLPLSALVSKQSCETVEIRSGSTMGVNGSTTSIPMKLSAVNPIVVGSCRLTTFKDLPEDCLIKSTISTQNTSFTSSNDNCNNNNTKMDVLREEEDCIEKDNNKSTEDYNLNSNCSKAATNGNKSSWSDNCEAHNLNSSHLTRQPYMDIMRKSKKSNHPHRYTFPPTSKAVTVDGIECTPCVVSDFKPSLRADFKSTGFLCNSLTKKSTQSIDSNGWPKSRLIDTTEKVTCTDFCDKDGSIYLNHCIVANNDGVDDVKMNSEKCLNAVDTNGDKFDGKIGQTNIKAEPVRSRRLTSFKGEIIKTDDKESDLETDENGIVTFKVGKPGFKRKSIIVAHRNHVNKPGSSTSLSSSAGSHSLSRSYSDSQLYSDSKDKIASIGKKRAVHETTSTCEPSGVIRRRVKRDTRACNHSLRWSTLSTSSSALSDGLEAPICYERRRCRPRPTDLPVKYISSDENHSADDEDSHEKFVSRWLRNGTGGLRWDDSEVTWKLNESLDWPESLDYVSSKKDDNFEEIPLLDDESDKIEIVTSVLPSSSKAEISDDPSDMASSVLDDNLVPETNFNGDFYRLCSVGSKTSLPEVPGLLSSTSFPLTDVKEQESVPDNDNLSSYSAVKESTDDIGLNEIKIIQKQYLDSNQHDEEILVITTDVVDHSVESSDQQKESMKPSSESTLLTSQLPVKSLHHSLAIKTESKEQDKTNIGLLESKTDDKIVIINHIPINPSTTKSSSCTSTTTSNTSPTKSLSPCSSNFSLKSSNSGQSSSTDKCKQPKSTINVSTGVKEKKPLKTFKSPVKESTTIVNNKNSKENHEENFKERSTLRDCNRTERSSEKGSENASLSSSSQTRPIPSLIKSHSSNYAKLSSATRIPLPKQSNSLDQIKTVKDVKLRHDTTEIGERMSTKNLIAKFSANPKKPNKQELTKSSNNNSKISNSDSSNSTGLISANSSKNEEKSEKSKEYIKNLETKRLRSEKSYNPSRKATDVPQNELKSPTAPSVEEFERRLSEDKQMAEKIKEFYSLFEERQSYNVECSSNKSKVNNSDKPILESIQCKLNYPKAILRRPKGEPSKTTKEGHETSWVHVSGFSVGKSENYEEKPTSSSSTVINNNKNSISKLSSDSCSSEDEANFNFNGKRRSSFHQRLLALHRSRRQRKRASGRYMGMGFLPRIRASIVDRLDFYHRFGEKEQKALSSFNFLNEFSISPLSSSSSSPVIECFEKFAEEQRLLIRCYLNSFSQLSQSSSLPASCSPPFTSKWPQSPSSSSLKCSPSRYQPSVAENTNDINDSDLNRKTIGTDYVDLITPNSFV